LPPSGEQAPFSKNIIYPNGLVKLMFKKKFSLIYRTQTDYSTLKHFLNACLKSLRDIPLGIRMGTRCLYWRCIQNLLKISRVFANRRWSPSVPNKYNTFIQSGHGIKIPRSKCSQDFKIFIRFQNISAFIKFHKISKFSKISVFIKFHKISKF
jgi:hypothetical protein